MRFIGKVFLIFSFILSYLALLICITARFQLLDSNFWVNSFRQGNVYERLEEPLSTEVEKTFLEEGAGKKEAKLFASIVAKDSLQDLVEKNTVNFLDYINQKSNDLIIYFPLDKLPTSLRQDLEINSNEFSLNYLLSTFGKGSTPIGEEVFVQLRSLGTVLTISLIIAIITTLVTLLMIYKLEEPGARLIATSISLTLSGILTLILLGLVNLQVTNTSSDLLMPGREPIQVLLGALLPPLLANIGNLWIIFSVVSIILGVVSFLLKKPVKSPGAAKTSRA